jgi:hypothetical protein
MARGLAIAVVAVLLLLAGTAPARAVTCDDLQDELAASSSGATVVVDEGSACHGHWNLPSHPLTLQGGGASGASLIGDGSNRILTGANTGVLAVQNLTFSGGRATGAGADGGAIEITGQSGLQVFNCKFFDNDAEDRGGAIHFAPATPPEGSNNLGFSAQGNVFGSTTDATQNNTALIGGAVSVESPGVNDQFSLGTNTFAKNVAQWTGGGFDFELAAGGGANVNLDHNQVLDNKAGGAGGGGNLAGPLGLVNITSELYQGNSVEPLSASPQGDHLGGGLLIHGLGPRMQNSTFRSNSVKAFPTGDLGGGGLAMVWVPPPTESPPPPPLNGSSKLTRIEGNTVAGQPDADWESEGGGLFISGNGSWTSFLDSVAGNSVGALGEGGGVYTGAGPIQSTVLSLAESTVAGNTVGALGRFAGVAGDLNDHLEAKNSIVYNGGPGDIGGFQSYDMQYTDACNDGPDPFAGEGNICANPLLIDAAGGNIHETAASPTIDRGKDELTQGAYGEDPYEDYEGDPRSTDGDGDGHTIDMGADESPAFVAGPPPPPAHTPQCSDGADNDGDGAIDTADPGCLAGPSDDNEGDETPRDLILCGQRTISLVRADVRGAKVVLSGFVATSVAGQKVQLSVRYLGRGGKPQKLGSVTPGADGTFQARVKKPSRSLVTLARYRAQVGSAKSVELKLPQSLASTSLKQVGGGMLELRGQVERALLGKRNAVVVKRILCGQYTTVGQAKPNERGVYTVRFPAPATGGSALYRAETKVLARPGSKRYVKQFARAIGITF